MKSDFIQATGETLYMTAITAIIAGILGMAIGIGLIVTQPGGILENRIIYNVLDKFVNLFRSIPFVILLAIIAPVTRIIVGTAIGTTAAIVPLVIGSAPFYARQIQNALAEVDHGVIEAAESVGSGPIAIIFRVYLKEGLADIIRSSVLTLISLIDLTAMAGAIGGGGLGNLAVNIGYNRFQTDVIFLAMLIILVIVFLIQLVGDWLARRVDHTA
ncbi:methionine ABC transporter permease [Levilactobacillus koreensis]|uniref:Methionine ABC transporter permease n=1 Tax=Levilactobacillus koreensis TaxID=637971 RepID=A0AAC8ZHJ1_9LACO|nr:methionine ABC transporter permease [Levilactobacillus koreensis]AKP66044.1 methionine ABC transporter permease [Levilactobacillus koreensis]